MRPILVRPILAIVMVLLTFGAKAQTADKPNILFIVLDDLNDFVGFLDAHPQVETPHLDELAAKGIVFENAFANSPKCAPSRTSFMTGKDPHYTKIYRNNPDYSPKRIFRLIFSDTTENETGYTLPEVLKDTGGYYSYGIHKIYHGWSYEHFDGDLDSVITDPCSRELSWSEFYDFPSESHMKIDGSLYGTGYHGLPSFQFGPTKSTSVNKTNEYRTVDSALTFFQRWETNPSRYCDRPFFLSLGFYRPHNPFYAPEQYFQEFYDRNFATSEYDIPYNQPSNLYPPNGLVIPWKTEFPGQDFDSLSLIAQQLGYNKDSIWVKFREFAEAEALTTPLITGLDSAAKIDVIEEAMQSLAIMSYLASIKYVDDQIGRLLDELDEMPAVRDNTVIVLFSDHGYSWGEHQHYKKQSLWETDIRVPLLIYDPRTNVRGRVNEAVGLVDLFPTILELTGTPEPSFPDGSRYLDGQSLVPLMENPNGYYNKPVLSSIMTSKQAPVAFCYPQYSVRDNRFHYIRYRDNGNPANTFCDFGASQVFEELYEIGANREIDPEEWNNLADDPEYARVKEYLSQWLPDGSMYNQEAIQLEIVNEGLPCLLDSADTLTLTANLIGTDGLLIGDGDLPPLSDQYSFVWTLYPDDQEVLGRSISVPLNSLTAAVTEGRLSAELQVYDSSGVFVYDRVQINLSSNAPSAAFAIDQDGFTVNCTAVPFNGKLSLSHWDFGDGQTYEGRDPAHGYNAPGTYTITHRFMYGNAFDTCEAIGTATVVIADSLFDSVCAQITSFHVNQISSHIAELDWTPVQGAQSYTLQGKPDRSGPSTLQSMTVSNPPVRLNVLKPATSFGVRVLAQCPAGDSEWSAPLHFTTDPCSPPRLFEVDSLSSDLVQVDFIPSVGDVHFSQFGAIQIGGPDLQTTTVPANQSTVTLSPLMPSTFYTIAAYSRCNQFDGSRRNSDNADVITIKTLDASPRLSAGVTDWQVYPTPTSGQLNIDFAADESRALELELHDAIGRKLHAEMLEAQEGLNSFTISLDHLPTGVYSLTVVGLPGGKMIQLTNP